MKKTHEILQRIGLNTTEVKIYLSLLETGPSTISMLRSNTEIPRTTLKENLERLITKMLVSQIIADNTKKYRAEDPKKLRQIVSDKKLVLEKQIDEIKDINKSLSTFINFTKFNYSVSAMPSIKILKGKSQVWSMYKETLKAKEVYSFCDLDRFYKVFPDTRIFFNEAFGKVSGRKVFDILLNTKLAQYISSTSHTDYYTKFLPNNSFFGGFVFGDYMIYDNQVSLVQLNKINPSAIVIESKEIYKGFVGLHKTMWELL